MVSTNAYCWLTTDSMLRPGTLRGHIGLIEEALDRLEGTATEADRGKKMFVYRKLRLLLR